MGRTLVALAPVVLVAAAGVAFSAFTEQTSSPGNSTSTGTVVIGDGDGADVPLYTVADAGNLRPPVVHGDQLRSRCITVTYTGSVPADVRLYTTAPITSASDFSVFLAVDPTPAAVAFPSCSGFDFGWGSDAFLRLDQFPTTFDTGYRPSTTPWTPGESRAYYVGITAVDDTTLDAHTTPHVSSTHTYRWEARSV